jgi:uncharacterized protein (TIGR03437 family)
VDVSPQVPVCGSEACQPIPVPMRPPATFLWEVNPFQLKGGGSGIIENAGVDYLLPYWMGRYYGAIPSGVQSSAAAGTPIAPGSLATFYGQNLVAATAQAMSQPLPLSLGGASLVVTDAAGVNRTAPLLYVSPGQVNFVVPDGVATGTATFAVTAGGATQRLTATVQPVAPTLFTMNGTGGGVAAALGPTPVFQCSSTGCSTVPITLGDQPVYLSFYGTGLRNRGSLANVTATINGTTAAASFAGPAPGFTGLDQVNVALPASLRGAGESIVYLTVDGQNSNVVNINVK